MDHPKGVPRVMVSGQIEPDKWPLDELARPCGPMTSVPSVRRGRVSFDGLKQIANRPSLIFKALDLGIKSPRRPYLSGRGRSKALGQTELVSTVSEEQWFAPLLGARTAVVLHRRRNN